MTKEELFNDIKTKLEGKIRFLEDKPEETTESTIKALWHFAFGRQISAELSNKLPLPELTDQQIKKLHKLIEKRINNTPLAYITGRQCFMGIEMLSDCRALIPRKETEILGKKALELISKIDAISSTINVVDACCGAGNIGLAIAYYNPKVVVYATDLSQDAMGLTKDNILFLNLKQRVHAEQGNLLSIFEQDGFYEKIDFIVCNPPYISSSKVAKLNIEISANEPTLAFDGGMLGTKIIQKLIREAPKFLKKNGWLIFEVGVGQGPFIIEICKKTLLYNKVESVPDDLGNIRVIAARK